MGDKRTFLFRNIPIEKRKLLLLDDEALYSVTDQHTANKISKTILKYVPSVQTITDGTACVGGNTYSFSVFFDRVYAVEIDPLRCSYLSHNLGILEVSNVMIFNIDIISCCKFLQQDMIFLDPPWGGPTYKSRQKINLYMSNIELSDVCKMLVPYTKYISIKVPTNFDVVNFNEKTGTVMRLLFHNVELRKMALLIYEVIV